MKSIEENWYDLLKIVIENGGAHEKDDGDILQEHLINHCMISNPLKQFGNQNITNEMFIDMIRKGVFDIKGYPMKGEALADYVTALDDSLQINNLEEGDFVYTYPERIFNIKCCDKKGEVINVNQFDVIVNRLKEHEGSNRAVACIYNGGLDQFEQHIPCLQWLQCTIRNNELILHVLFRSNDLFHAFPSNMLLLSYLGLKFESLLKKQYPTLTFEGINYNSTSLHIYKTDLKKAKEVLEKRG